MSLSIEDLEQYLPLHEKTKVLAANEDGLIALNKAAGILSHPNYLEDEDRSLLRSDYDLEQEFYEWEDADGQSCRAYLINRLDSPTSGVILLGLNAKITNCVKSLFATHKVAKVYTAIVKGKTKPPSGSWSDQLEKKIKSPGSQRVIKRQKIVAKARYQTTQFPKGGFPVSMLKLYPLTGRTHQLRIQCHKHNVPIVGDRNYGDFSFNKEVVEHTDIRRMMLHSQETTVNYVLDGKVRKFSAQSPIPPEFNKLLRYRPGLSLDRDTSKEESIADRRRFKTPRT